MEDKELILARKNLAISREWQKIRYHLANIIISSGSTYSSNGDYVKGMLKAIDVVDKWEDEFNALLKKENKENK